MGDKAIKKPAVIIMMILGILLAAGACFVLFYNAQAAREVTLPAETKINNDIMYEITKAKRDTLKTSGKFGLTQTGAGPEYYTIEGWAGIYGEDIRVFNTKVLLRNETNASYLQLKTAYVEDGKNPDVDNGGVSFKRGNFVAKVKDTKLEAGVDYRICIWYQNDGHNEVVETDKFLKRD
ncbi:MAG: hypothetical protein IJ121_05130 [Eubacterium sp.]|nr:hypothetical protein [Eubacterium sp.]